LEGGREMKRTVVVLILVCIGIVLGYAPLSAKEKYPARGINMLIPWPPGGMTDISGRIFANELSKNLNVAISPVNKPGAAGTVCLTAAYNAKKNGYTTMFASLGAFIGAAKLGVPFDPVKVFIPIALANYSSYGIFVRSDSPFKTYDDLMAKAKTKPEAVSMGCSVGGDAHFNLEIFQKATGVKFNFVPFGGGGKSTPAVLGGHVEAAMTLLPSLIPYVQAGKLRILAQIAEKRNKNIPDVPTLRERGFTETFIEKNWNGLFVPAGVPDYVIKSLASASEKAMQSQDLIDKMEKTGNTVEYMGHEEFWERIKTDYKLVQDLVEKLGLKKK
jgi:tripartite-type tricarboxylate transporter receptor subunit TctC